MERKPVKTDSRACQRRHDTAVGLWERVDARVKYLRSALSITPAQENLWTPFADVMRHGRGGGAAGAPLARPRATTLALRSESESESAPGTG
jgi:hypothetical protein